MDALQAIQTRHSIGRVKPDAAPRPGFEDRTVWME